MAIPVILHQVQLDHGLAESVSATVKLVRSRPGQAVAYTHGGTPIEIGIEVEVAFDDAGNLQAVVDGDLTPLRLRPNSGTSSDAIAQTPGTLWEYTLTRDGVAGAPRFLDVPDNEGPVRLSAVGADAPVS